MSDDMNPALKGFSPTWEKAKFFLGKVVKWLAIGALVGGIIAAIIPTLTVGVGGGLLSSIASIFSAKAGATVAVGTAAKIAAAALSGVLLGGGVGAIFGAAKGVSGMGEAADAEADRRVELMERSVTLDAQRRALANLQAPQMGGGLMPVGPGGMPLKDKGLRIS